MYNKCIRNNSKRKETQVPPIINMSVDSKKEKQRLPSTYMFLFNIMDLYKYYLYK